MNNPYSSNDAMPSKEELTKDQLESYVPIKVRTLLFAHKIISERCNNCRFDPTEVTQYYEIGKCACESWYRCEIHSALKDISRKDNKPTIFNQIDKGE